MAERFTDYEFKMILPLEDNNKNPIDIKKHKEYARKITDQFEGVTIIPKIVGCYYNDEGDWQCDKNIMFIANRFNPQKQSNFDEDMVFMKRLSKQAGYEFGQESIYADSEKDHRVVFVSGLKKKALPKYLLKKQDIFEELLKA